MPNGPSASRPRTRSCVMPFRASGAVDAQPRAQLIRIRAPRLRAALMRARNSGTRAASIVSPAACWWPPNLHEQIRAALERAEHVEVAECCGTTRAPRRRRSTTRSPACGRRPRASTRRCRSRRGASRRRRRPARCARRPRDRFRSPSSPARRGRLPPSGAAGFRRSVAGRAPRASSPIAFVGGEQKPRGDVGRAHAPGRVHTRRQHEARPDSCRSFSRSSPRHVEQRAQADRMRPLASATPARAAR